MLRYIMSRGNLPKSVSDWKKEQLIDFHSIYASYFFPGTANKTIRENPGDTLKMLFLSQIDFSIPFYLQSHACRMVLKDLYFETTNKELEMEHASLAELLTVCICKEYNLDYGNAFRESIHWTLSKLVNCSIKKEEQVRQINRFFQLLYGYKFVLNENQILHEIRSADQRLLDFLQKNARFISCSTWKRIIETAEKNSKLHEIFCASVISPQFADTMNQNRDYDFQFFKDRLSETTLDEIEKHLLTHSGDLIEFIVSKGNEVHLMHLLLSVSEKTAVKLIDQIPSWDLVRLISKNNNGLYLFAYYYRRLGDEVKKVLVGKLSAADFRDILINGGSISGFTFLLAVTEEPLGKSLLGLLTDDLIDRLIVNTVENNYSISMLNLSLREMKRKSVETLEAFEKAMGVSGYQELLKSQGTIPVLAGLITYSSSEMQKELSGMAQSNPELVKSLIAKTIEEGSSIGTLHLYLREMKRESVETLEAFEKAIGVNGYKELLKFQGTIPVLARLIQYSSSEMQKELSGMVQSNPELVKSLIEKTIEEGSSIGTLDLSLREMKRESVEALEAFEEVIGVNGYKELLKSQGTIPVLARLIRHSSFEMQKELLGMVQSNPELVKSLIEKTIEEGSSIGTLDLYLREMKRESVEALEAFEKAIGANGYKELLKSQGTIPVLAGLIRHSSSEMQKELSGMAQSNPELVKSLIEKTIEEGSSIGTLDLSLREMKRESGETLEVFEEAIGVNGYKELLKSQGTIPVLARLIRHSSSEMQKELSGMAQSNPELVKSLIEKTIEEGSSIGTLHLSLREMKRESVEAFEKAIGVNGYRELLKSQGTIPVLVRLIQHSSSEMQKELSGMAQSNPELVKVLVKKTIDKGERIGTLNDSIKALSRINDFFLQILERLIGTDGYLEMFSKCNANSITILRILACSSLSDSLVDKVYADMVVWNESKNHISEESCTILKDFDKDLYYAQGKGRNKFFRFFKEKVSSEELLGWIKQGATLEEAILIMRNLPLTMAKNLSMAWLENYDQVMEGIRFVEQQRNGRQAMNPQIVNRAIIKFKSFNQEFFVAIDKEYRMLLSNRDKGP